MKKFLSLALALVMTLSLVTISAGAAEYKDLTDKDEIQYEEAVAVLNRIGVITGYEDGSFKPENELTRGAAAKIIVSLLIGPEAAANLSKTNSPYPDVPAGSDFAGYISFCKTSKIINGYGDGTFRPQGTLTGFAFAKMLLGALGYSVDYEGMNGDGWNMVVANLGQSAGLFDRLKFNGNDPVNREMACQMALNTLKGTLVEYKGGMNITAGDTSMVVKPERIMKTSNQEYAKNIQNTRKQNAEDDFFTVEFAEEHFVDLRMTADKWRPTDDNFGNPSSEWDYRKVTIGTFALEPDFYFTTKVADKDKSTDASKVRALGLSGYKITDDTQLYINGKDTDTAILKDDGKYVTGKIADLTDNGTLVKVYVDNNVADVISAIVVIKSQLMEIKKIGSDFVSLDKYDGGDGANDQKPGFNQDVLDTKVNNVEVNDEYYEFLHGMKSGDKVVIVPVTVDHTSSTYEVGGAYLPETVSGTLTRVTTYGEVNDATNVGAIDITLGGTKYPIALWNAGDLNTITADIIDVTKKDVTLYLDSYGNAMLADEVGSQDGYMVIKGYYQSLVNGKLVTMVEGWDVGGDELSLNLGYNPARSTMVPGDLVKYRNDGTMPAGADWKIEDGNGARIYDVNTVGGYEIKASNLRVRLINGDASGSNVIDNGVKFIYVTFADDGDVDSIEIKSGVQSVENSELVKNNEYGAYSANSNPAEAYTNKDGAVKAVVIKRESNEAISNNLLYIRDVLNTEGVDNNGNKIYGYTVARMSADGLTEEETIYSSKKLNRGDFASYALSSHSEFDPFYTLKLHDVRYKTTSVNSAAVAEIMPLNKNLLRLGGYAAHGGTADTDIASDYRVLGDTVDGNESNIVNIRGAKWLDIATRDGRITSADELIDYMTGGDGKDDNGDYQYKANKSVEIQFVYNDNRDSDGFRMVSLIVVTKIDQARPPVGVDLSTILPKDKKIELGGVESTANATVTGSESPYGVTASFTMTSEQAKAVTKADVVPAAATNATLSNLTVKEAGDANATEIAAANTTPLMPDAATGDRYTISYKVTAANGDHAIYTLTVTIDDDVAPTVAIPDPAGVQSSMASAAGNSGYTPAITVDEDGAEITMTGKATGSKTEPTGIKVTRAAAPAAASVPYALNPDFGANNVATITAATLGEAWDWTDGSAEVPATPGTSAVEEELEWKTVTLTEEEKQSITDSSLDAAAVLALYQAKVPEIGTTVGAAKTGKLMTAETDGVEATTETEGVSAGTATLYYQAIKVAAADATEGTPLQPAKAAKLVITLDAAMLNELTEQGKYVITNIELTAAE